jgi:hypothetical protein
MERKGLALDRPGGPPLSSTSHRMECDEMKALMHKDPGNAAHFVGNRVRPYVIAPA